MNVMGLMPGSMPADIDTLAFSGKSAAKDNRSLDAVANGFESMFLSMILKEMRQSLEPGGLFGQDNSDIMGGFFDLYLGQHLAQTGSLGIGAMVKQQLLRTKPNDSA